MSVSSDAGESGPFLDLLGESDPQVRLNAAVRLAYLGDGRGADELVSGLMNESSSIRYSQVPEALELLGPCRIPEVAALAASEGPARLPAARVLWRWGRRGAAITALADGLSSELALGDWVFALDVVGEMRSDADVLDDRLESLTRDAAPWCSFALSTLAAVRGARATTEVRAALKDERSSVRRAAHRALAVLGTAAGSAAPALRAALRDDQIERRERLSAAYALMRVSPADAAMLVAALESDDRWLQIGLLRHLARVMPGARGAMSAEWPTWESQLVYSDCDRVGPDLEGLVEAEARARLQDRDHDLRRNAALVLSLCTPTPASVEVMGTAAALDEGLRLDTLAQLGAPAAVGGAEVPAVEMTDPPVDLGSIAQACESQWARRDGSDLDYVIDVPKWEFLHYLVERRGLVLHGSRVPGLDVLRPLSMSSTGTRTAAQPGVFGVDHALMAMYFAVVDRSRLRYLSNSISPRSQDPGDARTFALAAEWIGLAERPFIDATIYICPPERFALHGELTSVTPVTPLARLQVGPKDFPLIEHLWGSDITGLDQCFTSDRLHLRHVALVATQRSAVSAYQA